MKYGLLALLFLAGLLVMAATPTHAASMPKQNITGYLLTNNTVVFSDGTSMIVTSTPVMKNTTKVVATKYPLPHWMPKPFDGTYETCKMGVIGKNWKGDPVCYRPRKRR